MLKPYEEYNKCNLPWLTEIPKHWEWLRNKNIFKEEKEVVGDRKNEFTLLSLTKQGVIIRDLSTGKGKFPKDFDTYKVVKPGNMIFCLFDVDETPRTVGLSKNDGMITGAYEVFSINGANSEYLLYYYVAFDNIKAFKPLYSGLRKTIPLPSFMATRIPIPPISEQNQIVSYLNWKIAQMDYFVQEKEKEIRHLEELKKALINEAVTKGLDDNVPMQKTGIDWMPEIPKHWSYNKVSQLFTERRTKVSDKEFDALSVCKAGVVPQLESAVKTDNGDNRKLVCVDDFAINSRSDRKGSCGVSKYNGSVSLIITVLKPLKEIDSKFIHYLMRSNSFSEEFYKNGKGLVSDLWTTSYDAMKNIVLPNPPIKEQFNISYRCEHIESEIEEAISNIKKEISLVNELRTRTIADVVTGKVDVRNVKIPEEYKVV